MIKVKELLKEKTGSTWTIAPQDSVYRALEVMDEKNIGALVVVEDEKVVGIFSEREYARNVILKGKSSKDTSVSDLMNSKVCYVRPEQTIGRMYGVVYGKANPSFARPRGGKVNWHREHW